jgi:hypothetical protein
LNGKVRRYTPDFFLFDYGIYIEVKGYWWNNDREKMRLSMAQNPDKKIIIIEKDKYEMILNGKIDEVLNLPV